ncbi:phage holin family protein [Candidatus Kaiserbacteria bacterium]|nr:phage holin family protein [Candidatus Kaiserbacteria bacterium]
MNTLLTFAGTLAAVLLTVNIVPGITIAGGWTTVFLVALVWSVIVMVIRPVLQVLTFPITLITFGLFSFVLNAFLFYAMTWVVPGFSVSGFWSAAFGAVVLSLLTWLIQKVL